MKKLFLLLALLLALSADEPGRHHSGVVVETMNAGGYTYMKVKETDESYWVAVTAAPVRVGERVGFTAQIWMPQFKSRALDRTFERILFAVLDDMPASHPDIRAVKPANAPKQILAKAEGGYSVAEVFAHRMQLKGKTVTVHGKVTKIAAQIMKRNWVHLEDGTGDVATDDLVFTTPSAPGLKAGDIVTATGIVTVDKDFGYGYFYPVIIEQSSFRK